MGFRISSLQIAFDISGDIGFRVWGYGTTDPLEEVLRPGYMSIGPQMVRDGDLFLVRFATRTDSPRPALTTNRLAWLMVTGMLPDGGRTLRLLQDLGGPAELAPRDVIHAPAPEPAPLSARDESHGPAREPGAGPGPSPDPRPGTRPPPSALCPPPSAIHSPSAAAEREPAEADDPLAWPEAALARAPLPPQAIEQDEEGPAWGEVPGEPVRVRPDPDRLPRSRRGREPQDEPMPTPPHRRDAVAAPIPDAGAELRRLEALTREALARTGLAALGTGRPRRRA